MLIGAMTGCAENEIKKENNNTDIISESTSETSNVDSDTITIPHSYANASEGIKLRMANTEYFEKLTQNDLVYRVGKKGATLEEFKTLAKEQGDDFTDEEKQGIDETQM
ncbi:MAG: hypothetical protein HFI37_06010 [Lachnospiraceae bacterium]|nr:hypothetical protein [Lachnospiraceae bacterium]